VTTHAHCVRIAVVGMGNMGRRSHHGRWKWATTSRSGIGHPVEPLQSLPPECARPSHPTRPRFGGDVVMVVLADDTAVLEVCPGVEGELASLEPSAVLANCEHRCSNDGLRLARRRTRGSDPRPSGNGVTSDDRRRSGSSYWRLPRGDHLSGDFGDSDDPSCWRESCGAPWRSRWLVPSQEHPSR
jgi:hypothetical protein